MKSILETCLVFCVLLFAASCESDDSSIFLSESDLVKNWEIVRARDHDYTPGWYSVWTFNEDNTYSWYCEWPGYYDLSGSGSFFLEENSLHLTGVLPDNNVVDSIVELTFEESNEQFIFRDKDQGIWVYQTIDPEPEYSKNIPFYEQESYAGDCLSRPSGTTCLGFPDDYIWLIQGGLLEWQEYYGPEGYVIVGRGYDGFIDFPMEFHHVLNSNLVKRVQRY